VRCVSWNVNGIRAVHRKGIRPWDAVADAAIVCLQEVKARPDQVPPEVAAPPGWHAHWCSALRPGYAGVATFCRKPPTAVVVGLGRAEFDDEGRVLTVRFGRTHIVNAYFPNAQDGGARLAYKLAFCAALAEYLARLRRHGETLLVGDYNIAPTPIDLARPEDNETSPGYLPEERAWYAHYLGLGYHDVFRAEHPDLTGAYTWWSYRAGARARNVGWRIDHATVSPGLTGAATDVALHPDIEGSDHCPVSIALGRDWQDP
jgi:exodeoxyribonuclease-3